MRSPIQGDTGLNRPIEAPQPATREAAAAALRLRTDPAARAAFAGLGRSEGAPVTLAIADQRAWLAAFGCPRGQQPTDRVQSLSKSQRDSWTFRCGDEPHALWVDFATLPVASAP
jgi:hypothetical protein